MRWQQRARALLPVCALLCALPAATHCSRRSSEPEDPAVAAAAAETAVIRMTDGGTIRLRFHPKEAPRTTENFKKLARAGFYDGTTFHRIIAGFIIQGGDPNSKDDDPENDGFGGPGYTIPDEFSDLPHDRGTVSMAHPDTPNSAGSQFFIVLGATGPNGEDWHPLLDHKYTAFATVIEGMDVVDRLAALPTTPDALPPLQDRPIDPPVIASITIEGPTPVTGTAGAQTPSAGAGAAPEALPNPATNIATPPVPAADGPNGSESKP